MRWQLAQTTSHFSISASIDSQLMSRRTEAAHVVDLVAQVVKLEYDRIRLATVDAGMRA